MRLATLTLILLAISAPLAAQQQQGKSAGAGCGAALERNVDACVRSGKASDAQIRAYVIAQSIASYSGSCPCPYNVDRGGRSCGRRSAYSRPGGRSPLCYESDVSDQVVKQVRDKNRKP